MSNRRFNRFIKDSPVAIAGCANVGHILTGKWAIVDAAIALQNMVIAAWALGIGSCWIGAFDENKVKQLLKVPDSWKIVALITFRIPWRKSCKNLEILFVWPEHAPQPPPCLSLLNGMGGELHKEFGKRGREEYSCEATDLCFVSFVFFFANLVSTSPAKPIGLRLVINFVKCASESWNFFHY